MTGNNKNSKMRSSLFICYFNGMKDYFQESEGKSIGSQLVEYLLLVKVEHLRLIMALKFHFKFICKIFSVILLKLFMSLIFNVNILN